MSTNVKDCKNININFLQRKKKENKKVEKSISFKQQKSEFNENT